MRLGPSELYALALAAGIAGLVVLAYRHAHGPRAIMAAAFTPVVVTALMSPQFDLVGWHGFMHVSAVYQVMERGVIPPEDPLFAGATLRYPWVEHTVLAYTSSATGLNPNILALCLDGLAFVVFLGVVAWLASALTHDKLTIALATLICTYGVSIFHVGFFVEPLSRLLPWLWLENRVAPVDKFLSITAMPAGYAAMATAAAAGVHLAVGFARPIRLAALLAVATFVAALIHPPSWLGILGWTAVTGVVLLNGTPDEDIRRARSLALAVGIPSLLCLPYVLSIGASSSTDGWTGLTNTGALFSAKAADLAIFLLTGAVAIVWNRHDLFRRLREHDRATAILFGTIAFMSVSYLAVRTPGRNEYKFMLHMAPALAILIALALRRVLDTRRVVAAASLFLLVLPGARALGYRPWFRVTDPVRVDGRYLRALDPAADSLYQWITAHTPSDAVFIAPDLRVPPLGRRSLYVPIGAPWRGRDGWGSPHNDLIQWMIRRPDAEMFGRQRRAQEVLSGGWAGAASGTMAIIENDVGDRPVYVHATAPEAVEKLNATPGFAPVFRGGAGAVYSYRGPRIAAPDSMQRSSIK